jgi:hypothetical protein
MNSDKQAGELLSVSQEFLSVAWFCFALCVEFQILTKFGMNWRGLDRALPLLARAGIFGM